MSATPTHLEPTEAELNALAHRLAYQQSRETIECNTLMRRPSAGSLPVWDLSTADVHAVRAVSQAEFYLLTRGLLIRLASMPGRCVSIRDNTHSIWPKSPVRLEGFTGAPA